MLVAFTGIGRCRSGRARFRDWGRGRTGGEAVAKEDRRRMACGMARLTARMRSEGVKGLGKKITGDFGQPAHIGHVARDEHDPQLGAAPSLAPRVRGRRFPAWSCR